MEGRPSLGVDSLFEFHLNGPGSNHTRNTACEHQWADQGAFHYTYRDLISPAQLVAFLQRPEDNGKSLIVYGYDDVGQLLRREENGIWLNGYRVPTIFGVAVPDSQAPRIARITGVFKDIFVGSVRLATTDSSGTTGVNLAVYEFDEQVPQYRRIKLNRCAKWVRIAYLRANPIFQSRADHVPMLSRIAFLIGMQARKDYSDRQWADAHAAEADAARLEVEAQMKAEPPVYMPIQVIDRNSPRSKEDTTSDNERWAFTILTEPSSRNEFQHGARSTAAGAILSSINTINLGGVLSCRPDRCLVMFPRATSGFTIFRPNDVSNSAWPSWTAWSMSLRIRFWNSGSFLTCSCSRGLSGYFSCRPSNRRAD